MIGVSTILTLIGVVVYAIMTAKDVDQFEDLG